MSVMSNQAVLKCKRCGDPYILAELVTAKSDPNLTDLHKSMRMIADKGWCPKCWKQLNYYVSIGQGQAYLEGRVF